MFIGNSRQYSKLISWLQKPIESGETLHYKHICIVIGAPGIGKTYGIDTAVKSVSKTLYRLNDLDCNNSKDFKDLLKKITSAHIISQIENISNEQKIIWLDDFDSYLIFDRTFLHTLENILNDEKFPAIKIVISTTNADLKHYTKFYNLGCIIKLNIPDIAAIIIFLRSTYKHLSVKIISHIADLSHGNVSAAIQMANLENRMPENKEVEELSLELDTMQIDNNVDNDILPNTNNTNIDVIETNDKFPELVDLFAEPYDIEVGRFLFDQDPWLHPLRFHENLLNEFKIRKGLQEDKNKTYIDILQLFCEWDQLMSYAKVNDGSGMNNAIEIISSVPYYLKNYPKKKNAESSMDEFTRMFNYLSLKKKNAVALYVPDFPWITIGSYYKHLYDDINKIKKASKTKKFST